MDFCSDMLAILSFGREVTYDAAAEDLSYFGPQQ